MTKAERFLTALKGGIPDKVPFVLHSIYQNVQEEILGHKITLPVYNGMNNAGWLGFPEEGPRVEPCFCCVPETAEKLNLDAMVIQVVPPMFVKREIRGTDACVAGGIIESREVFERCKRAMPDPDDGGVIDAIKEMIGLCREHEFAVGAKIRLGASPTLLSIGMENLAMMLAEEDDTLERTIEMYTSWSHRFNKNLMEAGFDYFWAADDIAYTNSLLISPEMFREYFKEGMSHAKAPVTRPFIYHSDGDYSKVLGDLLDIGVDAIHPIERGSMDQEWLLANYKGRLAMVGNVDINHILHDATEEEVYEDVRTRIETYGPGGGYVICDSNSVPGWCSPRNVLALSEAVERYRNIY
ncbi:MAG: hypothetical protein HFI33_04870 [Lachnospiraceae bacterium]|nr:hypothetical protein [Lachnospiraceae bacterium]